MATDVNLGDIVRLKKVHPCGGYEWQVVRLGADIGIKCTKCERRVLIPRSIFQRRIREVVKKADES